MNRSLIVISAALADDGPVEASIAVGLESNCACRIGAGDTHLGSTVPDARWFERAEIGVYGYDDSADS